MKIGRIITSINDNPDYVSFAQFTCWAWHKLGYNVTLNIVGDHTVDVGETADVVNWENLPYVESKKQSQFIRMYNASTYGDEVCMIADIDMVPLSDAPLIAYGWVPEDHLAQFGYEHPAFQRHPDIGKWPMHGTAGKGSTFKEIINPNDKSLASCVSEWNISIPDYRARPMMSGYFCDESLIKCLLDQWSGKDSRVSKIRREESGDFKQHADGGYTVYGRIDREKWKTLEGENLQDYFEIHGPRPFTEEWYGSVTKHLEETTK